MKIIRVHYKVAKKVESYSQIKNEVKELKAFTNAKHKGLWETAFSIHHAQVSEDPYNFFVLNSRFIKGKDKLFKHRVIINPRITKLVGDSQVEIEEACMSFPHRKVKYVRRFLHIGVTYQTPFLGVALRRVYIDDLKETAAQIFAHETEHGQGKNIYFEK